MVAQLWVLRGPRQVCLGQICIFSSCFAEKRVFQQVLHILLTPLVQNQLQASTGALEPSLPLAASFISCLLSVFPIPRVPPVFLAESVCCLSVSLPGTPCHSATAIPEQSSSLHSQSPELSQGCAGCLLSENILPPYICRGLSWMQALQKESQIPSFS